MSRTTLRVALALSAVSFVLSGSGVRLRAQDQPRPTPTAVWAPKPTETPAHTPPQKPWIKASAIWRDRVPVLLQSVQATSDYMPRPQES